MTAHHISVPGAGPTQQGEPARMPAGNQGHAAPPPGPGTTAGLGPIGTRHTAGTEPRTAAPDQPTDCDLCAGESVVPGLVQRDGSITDERCARCATTQGATA